MAYELGCICEDCTATRAWMIKNEPANIGFTEPYETNPFIKNHYPVPSTLGPVHINPHCVIIERAYEFAGDDSYFIRKI